MLLGLMLALLPIELPIIADAVVIKVTTDCITEILDVDLEDVINEII